MADIFFLPGAEADYQEALHWYQERSPRVADKFEAALESALNRIAEGPERWPLLDDIHRFVLFKRFPYSLVYRIEEDLVVVVAVAHARRKPEYWKNRK